MVYAQLDITPSGYFTALPSTVGSSDDEIVSFIRGDAKPDRIKIVTDNLELAANKLYATEPAGHC